jgi:hypothetical protein
MSTDVTAMPTTPWRALVRLHAGAGTRAALRSGAIGVGVVIVAFGMAPSPAYTLMRFILGIVAPPPPGAWDAIPESRLELALLALGFAAVGARRVTAGATGWMASLPASRRSARRAAWAASTGAALPVAVFLVGACLMTPTVYRSALVPMAVLSLPLVLAAAGAAALPVRAWGWRGVALLALLASVRHDAAGAAIAVALLLAWDRGVAGLAPPFRRMARDELPSRGRMARDTRASRAGASPSASPRAAAFTLALRWSWRAAGARAWLEALLLATLFVSFTALARRNNPDLAPATLDVIGRIGAGIGVTVAVAAMGAALLARRPPWAWLRTLPWSARGRVAVDLAALAGPALVVIVVIVATGATFGLAALPATLGVATVTVPSAAGALRVGARRQTGAWGEPGLVGLLAVSLLAWWPWLALATPVLGVALALRAERRDRRDDGAVRWSELRHDLASDAGWIGRT